MARHLPALTMGVAHDGRPVEMAVGGEKDVGLHDENVVDERPFPPNRVAVLDRFAVRITCSGLFRRIVGKEVAGCCFPPKLLVTTPRIVWNPALDNYLQKFVEKGDCYVT
jgi:hypothetical protein